MILKRRKFLGLFGAATMAPLMPFPNVAAATASTQTAPFSMAAVRAATAHAKTRVSISSWSLAQNLGIPAKQAEALMTDLADRGILAHLRGSQSGSQWAHSRVYQAPFAKRSAANEEKARSGKTADDQTYSQPDLTRLMAHLRDISTRYFAAQTA